MMSENLKNKKKPNQQFPNASYTELQQTPEETSNWLNPFKGYLFAMLSSASFITGNVLLKTIHSLSAVDNLTSFYMMTLLIIPC